MNRLSTWRATPPAMRRMLLEAAFELLRARLLIAFGLRRALPLLLVRPDAAEAAPPEQLQRDLRYILALAAARVPWRSVCLPNAIAARRMLARRGYGSTLHLGVGHNAAGDPHAHAWLEAGGLIVTGEDGRETVTALPLGTPGRQAGR